jgi:hypothetical protein
MLHSSPRSSNHTLQPPMPQGHTRGTDRLAKPARDQVPTVILHGGRTRSKRYGRCVPGTHNRSPCAAKRTAGICRSRREQLPQTCGLTLELTGTQRHGAAWRTLTSTPCGAMPLRVRVERLVRAKCHVISPTACAGWPSVSPMSQRLSTGQYWTAIAGSHFEQKPALLRSDHQA